ncbi:cysteine-rich VLP protein [uncultured Oscillibacter sp.]|uniref:cysteine-rich VLP protein n=1 Tax=uncultured Oscillibacter sp. TaxID=876091 RepID=UPI00342D092E
MDNSIPHLRYQQFRTVQRLVHQCCNNVDGNCLLLDDGWEPCVCVQSISRSLVCKYFRAAVLPLDRELETVLLYKKDSKPCCRCGVLFRPGSNRGKYCPGCAAAVHRQQKAESERRRRAERGQLGA